MNIDGHDGIPFVRHTEFILNCYDDDDPYFLHARPWIPGDEIAIFTAVIHEWRSSLRQFARAIEYDVTMLVTYIRVTSRIYCGDVTILNQKRLSLATTAKSAIDNCFGEIECSGHQIACTFHKQSMSLIW